MYHVCRVSPVCPQWAISVTAQCHNQKGFFSREVWTLTLQGRVKEGGKHCVKCRFSPERRCLKRLGDGWHLLYSYLFEMRHPHTCSAQTGSKTYIKEQMDFPEAALSRFIVVWAPIAGVGVELRHLLIWMALSIFKQNEWVGYYFWCCSCSVPVKLILRE